MARYDRSVQIAAPPDVVWSILQDVEKWPEWTPSILNVARQEQGSFGLNSTAKVKAKGFPESLLKVTEFSPGRSFIWEGPGGIGMRVLMSHVVEPADGGSRVTLSIIPTGPAAPFMGWLVVRMSKANVNIEAESLKQRAEAVAAGS